MAMLLSTYAGVLETTNSLGSDTKYLGNASAII